MALFALILSLGAVLNLGLIRRDLARLQQELMDIHESVVKLRSEIP